MGKYDLGNRPSICLTALIISVLVAAGPQTVWAQEAAGADTPSTEESASGMDGAEEADAQDADPNEAETDAGETASADTSDTEMESVPADMADESADADAADAAMAEAAAGSSAAASETAVTGTDTANSAAQTGSAEINAEAASEESTTLAESDAAAGSSDADLFSDFESTPAGAGEPASGTADVGADTGRRSRAAEDAADDSEPAAAGEPGADDIPANDTSSSTPADAEDPLAGSDNPFQFDGEAVEKATSEEPEADTNDPLEGMNRAFFKFNDFLDRLVLKPAAGVYRFILPDYVEDRIRNVVNNADTPVTLANDILQWKWDRAWNTTSRFFINTTLGVGGIWDVAASFGIDRHEEDFGQTLCVWGINEGLYLYLPFVGPTNPRDMAGKVADRYFHPLTYYADIVQQVNLSDGVKIRWNIDRAGWASIALSSADLIDMRARNIETINEIERTSIDFYTAVRSLYRQSRESACNDGQVDFEDLPDLSDEFE